MNPRSDLRSQKPIRILILEDIPADTELVVSELSDAELHYELAICRTNDEFSDQLSQFNADIILTPYSLTYTNAIKALKFCRSQELDTPFVLLAQDLSEDIAIELLKTGIEDYVLRSTLKRLPIAIKKALYKHNTQHELQISKNMVRASEASLINMVRNTPMAVAMFDLEMRYLVISEPWMQHEGIPEEELIGKCHYDIVPELPDHWRKVHQDCLKGATRENDKEKLIRASGKVEWLRWKINPWYTPEGKIGGIVLFIEDITEKVNAEEKIMQSEESLRLAQSVANVGSFELNLETRELKWSDQMYEIFGLKPGPVTYEHVIDFFHPDDRKQATRETEQRALTGKPEMVSYRILTSEGQTKYVESVARIVEKKGESPKLIGIVRDVTSKRLLEAEVSQNEERLELAIKASKLGVWEWQLSTGKLFWDSRCLDIFGHGHKPMDELDKFLELVHADDIDSLRNGFRSLSKGEGSMNQDVRLFDGSGNIKYVNIKVGANRSGVGTNDVVYGVVRDRTRRVQELEKLAQNEQVFRQLAENIAEVFYLTEIATNKVLFISETYEEVYGQTAESLYEDSMTWSQNIHGDDRERAITAYRDNARSGTYDEEYRIVLPNGDIKWVRDRAFPIKDRSGKVVRIAGLAEDITQRIENEQQIQMLSQVASETVNGVLIHDSKGRIEWMNQAFTDITGYTLEQVRGKEPWSFLSGPDTDEKLIALTYESVQRKKAFSSENILYGLDGRKIWVQTNFTPILDSKGEVNRIISIGTDITQIKEVEQVQKEMMASLEKQVSERTSLLEAANRKLMGEISERERVSQALNQNNDDLISSLTYALKIQEAILPPEEILTDSFSDAFVWSKALNVASGDFHWHYKTETHTFVAVVDCTGHGVSGSLMSMIGHQLLNQIVISDRVTEPGLILKELNMAVEKVLTPNEDGAGLNDGMDIGLISVDHSTNELTYSGAFNSLYHASGNAVNVLSGNRYSVGGRYDNSERSYESQHLVLKTGDTLYLSTDGFVNQFGGPNGKKYMKRKYQEFIQSLTAAPFEEHASKFEEEYNRWADDLAQVDDILVIGLRI